MTPIAPELSIDPSQLAILVEVARLASEDLELRPMLQRITDALLARLDWELVALVRVDREANRFVCEALSSRIPTSVFVGYGRNIGSGVVGEVAASGRAMVINDARLYPNFVETQSGTLAELCVPIVHRGEVVGLLNAESPRMAAFAEQLAFGEAIARQVAGVIAHARLFERLTETSRALEEANRALEQLSLRDPLTGLANRRHFDAVLDLEWRRLARSHEPLSLLVVDVDHFKDYNDFHGHPAGDECLRRIAGVLHSSAQRAGELVARTGGEEFTVILPARDAHAADTLAESMRQRVVDLGIPRYEAGGPPVTISIGLATCVPDREHEPHRLVQEADRGVYQAKRDGRNRVAVAIRTGLESKGPGQSPD